MTKNQKINLAIAIVLISLAVSLRILPHPANFAPITAVALFGGAVLPRRYGLSVPLAAMIISDLVIGLHSLVLVTWGLYALMALAASHWLRRPSILRGAGLVAGSSVLFFVVTNFAVWLTSGMYALTWAGLARCFELALPFFRNTFASDVFYSVLLFGLYALALRAGQYLFNLRQPTSA